MRILILFICYWLIRAFLFAACRSQDMSIARWSAETVAWMDVLYELVKAATLVSSIVAQRATSVLVFCNNGSDTTSIVVSIAKLILDPHYRTIRGFEALVEEDWLCCGHCFGDYGRVDGQPPPFFALLLDCTYQLLVRFPSSFEFDQRLLLLVHRNMFSGQFGTFLLNSEQERITTDVHSRGASFWKWTSTMQVGLCNSSYMKNPLVLDVSGFSAKYVRFWQGFYDPWNQRDRDGDAPIHGLHKALNSISNDIRQIEMQLKERQLEFGRSKSASKAEICQRCHSPLCICDI